LTTQIHCGQPGIPNNGSHNLSKISSGNDFASGTVVQYYCESDSLLFGREQRRCHPSGIWDNKVPQCVQRLNIISYLSYDINQSSDYKKAIDSDLKTCFESISSKKEINHWWQISFKQELEIKAIRLTFSHQNYSISHLNYTLWIHSRKDQKSFEVPKMKKWNVVDDKMYVYVHISTGIISGDSIRIYSSESLKFILCEVEIFSLNNNNKPKCGTPDSPSNGEVKTKLKNNQLFATFSCSENYFLSHTQEIKCDEPETWSASTPLCYAKNSQTKNTNQNFSKTTIQMTTTTTKLSSNPISCSELKVINGKFNYTNNLNSGSRAFLQCDIGFKISSKYQSSECLPNGN